MLSDVAKAYTPLTFAEKIVRPYSAAYCMVRCILLQEIAVGMVVLVLIYILLNYLMKPKGMPPGARLLPILGNLIDLARWNNAKTLPIELTELSKKYGNIYTLELPGQRIVVINSIAIAREALLTKKDDFAGRPMSFVLHYLTCGSKDIVMGDFNPTWVLQRKIVHSAIRMYNPFLEKKVNKEVEELTKRLIGGNQNPVDPFNDVILTTMNVICAMVIGGLYKMDEEFLKKVSLFKRLSSLTGPFNILNIAPFTIHFPLAISKEIKDVREIIHQMFIQKYHEHQESYQDGVIRDLTDALIKALHDAQQEDSKTHDLITEDHLVMTMFDAFAAGFETTATTILWFMTFMVSYPDIQSKIQSELDSVVGRDTLPRWEDRSRLPYLVAAIEETLRVATVAPLLVPHKAMRDSTLAGFNIPKGTNLMFNAWAMHRDEKEWPDPHVFNPSRFINADGKVDQVAKSFLPFGMGRRVCVGESLAKQELFIIASRLLHQVSLEIPPGSSPLQMNSNFPGLVHYPPRVEMYFKSRK